MSCRLRLYRAQQYLLLYLSTPVNRCRVEAEKSTARGRVDFNDYRNSCAWRSSRRSLRYSATSASLVRESRRVESRSTLSFSSDSVGLISRMAALREGA